MKQQSHYLRLYSALSSPRIQQVTTDDYSGANQRHVKPSSFSIDDALQSLQNAPKATGG